MSKGDTFENDWLKLVFNATAIANLADNASASPVTNLYVSFHTADPGEAGSQTTSEASYTGYARTAVARTAGGWAVTGSSASPVADVTAPTSTGGSTTTLTHAAVGTVISGAGKILYRGALTPSITMATGVAPKLGAGSTFTED